jgi:hypothetical protein
MVSDMENDDPRSIRIGELLVQAGMLSPDDLDDALEIAQDSRQLIGRVLIMSGFITDHQLQVALKAQEHMRNGQLGLDDAIESLRLADASNITFDQALSQLGRTIA